MSTFSYNKLFKLNVEVSKINYQFERNIEGFNNHDKFVENENNKMSDENYELKKQTLKSIWCEKYDLLRYKVDSLKETLINLLEVKIILIKFI